VVARRITFGSPPEFSSNFDRRRNRARTASAPRRSGSVRLAMHCTPETVTLGWSGWLALHVFTPGVSGKMREVSHLRWWKFFPRGKAYRMDEKTPGLSYAAARLWRMAFPNVKVTPPAAGIRFERDVPVPLQDGTTLCANVFRPNDRGRFPVLMSAHPTARTCFRSARHWAICRLPATGSSGRRDRSPTPPTRRGRDRIPATGYRVAMS